MKKTVLLLLLLLIPIAVMPSPQQPAKSDKPFTVSVDVDLVIFNVTVLDKKGHLVPGLDQSSFRVYEDGKGQEVTLFHPEDIPATVGLLIDNSGSMSNKIGEVIHAASEFIQDSNPLDELFLVNFNDRVSMGLPYGTPFTSNVSDIDAALHTIHANGRTALYDAVAFALRHLERGTLQKKALVVLSDGGDNASHITLKDLIPVSEKSSATIYTIGIYDDNDPDKNPKVLRELAKISGGEAYLPRSVFQLAEVWRSIAGGIRSQYTIGYVSTNQAHDGTFRNVRIAVVDKKGKPLVSRTRSGYRAPTP
jgi:VWFA-related protein